MNTAKSFAIQAAKAVLSDNLKLYGADYATKGEFVSAADNICNQFPDEESVLSVEEIERLAAQIWDDKADQDFAAWDAAHG